MKKTTVAVVIGLLMMFASAPFILVVGATKPETVSGIYHPIGPPTESNHRSAGKSGNEFADVSIPVQWEGSIAGVGVNEMSWIFHDEGVADAVTIIHGVTTLAGIKIWGATKMGTLTIEIKNTVVGSVSQGGQWRILGGTGELADLHGEGKLAGTSSQYILAYSGQIHFDP